MFEPTAADKQWMKNLLDMINDGGIWGTSFAVYRLDKSTKELHEVTDAIPFLNDNQEEDRNRVRTVAEAIGWKIV